MAMSSETSVSGALLSQAQRRLDEARELEPERWTHILTTKDVARSLARVWACSEFVAASCLRDPTLLERLIADGRLLERADKDWIHRDLPEAAGESTDEMLMEVLRRFRRRHMVRIAWRDLAGWADLDETLHDLTQLADACIGFAYRRMYASLCTRYGTPRGQFSAEPQPLMILAMGKLGGEELNFSSDIDLVLVYPEEGETDGARSTSNSEFFLRLSQKIVQMLAAPTVEGFAYRVDLRLRPFGDSGRVALSFDAFENYLQQHGRDWERYAYVKARPVTATEHFSALYEQVLRPFVHRRYLDFGVFEALRDMKAMIAREVERRELVDNIKLGPGGIREIEFIVQAFQLIRGGNDRRLQTRRLRAVLPHLSSERLLGARAVRELDAAYCFLRELENRLQEWNDEQLHELPEDDAARQRLVYAMNAASWNALLERLDVHRECVTRHFKLTVFGPAGESSDGAMLPPALFDLDAAPDERNALLKKMGFADPRETGERLDELRSGSYYRRLDTTGQRRLRELLPRLLPAIARSGAPAVTLTRIAKILEMIGGRTVYLALLNENAAALQRLVDLCAQSQFLADQIAAHPLLLDELIDKRLIEAHATREEFAADLAARHPMMASEDPERQVEILLQFQRAAIFRVALEDLSGRLPLMKVSDRLTDIAELIVSEALRLAWLQLVSRHGVPKVSVDGTTREASMLVVAYGKLGGLELGYGSDLDLVFLHDSSGEMQRTDGAQPVENTVFFQRLGQRLVHLLTVHSAAGRLYEVDTRLRPGGNRGLLVQSLGSFRDYEFQEAWTWEHQSLLRARAIAGAPALREEFETARIEILRKGVRRDDLRQEVRKMRERMRDNLSKAKSGQFDLKQDAGGIADLEFLVQFWMLKWADRYPEIVTFSDNIRQLETLASGNIVPQTRVDFLVNTYRQYRARLHHLSLDGAKSVVGEEEFRAERAGVIGIWQEVMAEDGHTPAST
jgi:[glutamine synthetase] adenylyltransferase / [glutamine synthetase]-adenylyl-L-tyrosine phosphorylase